MLEGFKSIILLIVFLVPGFVWRTVEAQLVYLDRRLEWEKFALGLLTRSTIIYLPFAAIIYRGWKNKWYDTHPIAIGFTMIGFILFMPIIAGFATGFIRQKGWIQNLLSWAKIDSFESNKIPTAWDSLFTKLPPSWVIVTLENGTKVYGYLSRDSIISSDYDCRDLYISHTLLKNSKGILEFVPNTKGVYIRAEQISTIEFTEDQNK